MTHCNEKELTSWGTTGCLSEKVLKRCMGFVLNVLIRWFGGEFKEAGPFSRLNAVRKGGKSMVGYADLI